MQKQENRTKLIAAVFESSREGVVILDRSGHVLCANATFTRLTGLTESDILGTHPEFILTENGRDRRKDIWDALLKSGTWCGEVDSIQSSGGLVWVNIESVSLDKDLYYVARFTNVSAIDDSRYEFGYVATHDTLTGLPNRTLFNDRLFQAVSRSLRYDTQGAVLFLDLTRFKNINDSLGHHVGDELLKQFADRLHSLCRSGDTLARIGGDEFILVAENLSRPQDAAIVAQNLIENIARPFNLSGHEVTISASIGISVFPRDGDNVDLLAKQADSAMYYAKNQGENTYRFFTQDLTDHAFEHFAMEESLRRAMRRQEFFLEYQPQLSVGSGELVGMEALIRWQHPDLGRIMPDRFIPIAEVSGLVDPIGMWVLDEVCRQAGEWGRQGLGDSPVAVNLSHAQVVKSNFADNVERCLTRYDTNPGLLEFEITENAILGHEEVVYKNLRRLKRMGCRLSIDNFGSGNSSLHGLKRVGFDRLKVDRTLVRDISHDADDEAVIRAVVALGGSLGIEVLAEGVETEAQYRFLAEQGCHQVQGFWFMPPLSVDAAGRILRRKSSVLRIV